MAYQAPGSILVVGSGVFGLATAYELAMNPTFKTTNITIIDRFPFPAPDGASIDTSRIVRSDYAVPAYANLAAKAQALWRSSWGADNRYHESGLILTAELGREGYVISSLDNVRALLKKGVLASGNGVDDLDKPPAVEALESPSDIIRASGTPGSNGALGYINRLSGWADAEATMRWLRERVVSTGRVNFISGSVTRLLFCSSGTSVLGAEYIPYTSTHQNSTEKKQAKAELTILAAGAWTPTLIDLRGRVQATAQTMAYISLTDAEAEELSKTPTQLNMSTGLFTIPPPAPSQVLAFPSGERNDREQARRLYLKVARHAHGYANPTSIPNPEPHKSAARTITVSTPHTSPTTALASQTLPPASILSLRDFVRSLFPNTALATRPFAATRLCHYADTPTGDFLMDYHPGYARSLFVTTGGSGHAFKFVPVLGESAVRCIMGACPDEFRERWCWREKRQGEWSVEDGTRGGERGLKLDERLKDDMERLRSKM